MLPSEEDTAKIALHMARGDGHHGPAFVFRRPTRGLDANGHAFGSKASREARANAHAPSQLRAEGAEHGGKRQNVGGAER